MYVITIKRIKSYTGATLENPRYEYAGIDEYAGSFSTGCPMFSRERSHAVEFDSMEKAFEWWNNCKRFLTQHYSIHDFDWSTLGIREERVTYYLKQKLVADKD